MAKGDGSIIKLGRDHWRVRVDYGKDPLTGKRQVVSKTIHGTKADARRLRDKLRAEKESGIRPNAGKITLSEFIVDWANSRRTVGKASERTITGEQRALRHVEKHLGSCRIADITPQMIERAYALIREEGKIGGTTLNKIHTSLKNVFRKAHDYGLIMRNPCDHVEAPQRDKAERKSLTKEEFSRLASRLSEAERATYEALSEKEAKQFERGNTFGRSFIRGIAPISCVQVVRIAAATGMRRGEILGLTWGAVDLQRKSISVRQSLSADGELKKPKTQAGIRTISMGESSVQSLLQWKARQAAELRKFGVVQTDDTPVCCSNVGGFLNGSNFEHWWKKFRIANGFPDLKLHELRHTQATLLVGEGTDIKTVQDRLGHSSASTTLDWYSHAMPENDLAAAQHIDNLFDEESQSVITKFEERKSA
ncbi:tyrosine-type recombinase/integrase [Anaerotardibacter muris]|uniref:tyrosine-type recombinase/integrase n=1 Tax=Anaerotardibacter muris TaxID=2941505 RepID=UPI0020411426|nr:tyrosine-type recombinase/integrase [Anaerotardibacter muris]